jgi:histidine triad (HIT) family protein
MSTIFKKIIDGDIPSYKIYENEHTFAFLDISPVQLGHTLVVPKVEIDYFLDVPEPYYSAVFTTAKLVAKAIHRATTCQRVGTIILGFDVPHFHYHLIPMFTPDDLDLRKAKSRSEQEMKKIQQDIIKFL